MIDGGYEKEICIFSQNLQNICRTLGPGGGGPRGPRGSWSAIFCALSATFPGASRDLSRTSGRPRATFSRPPRGVLRAFRGLLRDLSGRGQKRKRARTVVKSHRIGTKIRQHGEEDMGSPVFGSPGLERAQKWPNNAKTGFRENPKNLRFL